jgi:hypothetical protein
MLHYWLHTHFPSHTICLKEKQSTAQARSKMINLLGAMQLIRHYSKMYEYLLDPFHINYLQ